MQRLALREIVEEIRLLKLYAVDGPFQFVKNLKNILLIFLLTLLYLMQI